ncbi:MAG TPA: hypothetical protein PKY56_02575 [Candidatus Kapabacteria bacterium]|nr:hypothetical protein [Candidatus Kapabacteria bacterium]
MAEKETKFVFSGEDNLSPLYDKISKETKNLFGEVVRDVAGATNSYRDFEKRLRDQIKLLEEEAEAVDNLNKLQAKHKYESTVSNIRQRKSEAEKIYASPEKYGAKESIEAGAKLHTGSFEKEEAKAKELYNLEIIDLKESRIHRRVVQEQLRLMIDQYTKTATEQYQNLTKKEKEAAKEKITPITGDQTGEEIIEKYIKGEQSEKDKELKDDKKSFSVMAGTFLGNMAAQTWGRMRGLPGQIIGETAGEYMAADVAQIIPVIGDAASQALKKHLQEKEEASRASNILAGITGYSEWISRTSLGYDYSETLPIAADLARKRGYAGDIKQDVLNTIALSKAYGVQPGEITSYEGIQRYTTSREGATVDIKNLIEIMKKEFGGGDYSRLMEFTNAQSQIIESKSSLMNAVNPLSISTGLEAIYSIGGMYTNKPEEMLNKLDQSLMNPQGEYNQALSYMALSQVSPKSSWLDIQQMQEGGIYTPGYMSKIMENIRGMYGGGEEGAIALMNELGLGAGQAKTLWESYKQNPELFSTITSIREIMPTPQGVQDKYFTDTYQRGVGLTTSIQQQQAAISNAYAESAAKGLEKSFDLLSDKIDELSSSILGLSNSNSTMQNILKTVVNPLRLIFGSN